MYSAMGRVHGAMLDHPQALVYYRKALTISIVAVGPNHPGAAICHHNVAATLHGLGDHTAALEQYRINHG